ncbi:MAG: ROK family protein [Candidatus Caenarcaniphilales bacterium]|nr:ROK family protein [Candidatus Caenarcaniphilales bacterium]
MSNLVLGIDIGGTKIATGAVDEHGQIVKSVQVSTHASRTKEEILNQVFLSVEKILESGINLKDIRGIGVGAPGPLKEGILINPPNIAAWQNFPIAKLITEKYGLPTFAENDANAAAYAELVFGAAKGYKNFVYVTVSTGIGTGIIIDGKIYRGMNGLAGEGGHVCINYDQDINAHSKVGVLGSVENLASGTAIAKEAQRLLRQNPKTETSLLKFVKTDESGKHKDKDGNICEISLSKITTYEIGEAIKENDEFSKNLIKRAGHLIGVWMGGIISLLDPEIIVIGGGVMEIGEVLLEQIRETAPKFTINQFASNTPIIPAGLKGQVGIQGAASLIHQRLTR